MQSTFLNQAYVFVIFFVTGIIIGILFDIFRIIRKTFKTCNLIIYIEDFIFWIMSGIILLYTIFIFNNGEIRAYIFIAIFLGFVIYSLTFSKFFVIIGYGFSKFLVKIAHIILKFILLILKKMIFKPITFISINISKLSKFFNKIPKISKKCKIKKG